MKEFIGSDQIVVGARAGGKARFGRPAMADRAEAAKSTLSEVEQHIRDTEAFLREESKLFSGSSHSLPQLFAMHCAFCLCVSQDPEPNPPRSLALSATHSRW